MSLSNDLFDSDSDTLSSSESQWEQRKQDQQLLTRNCIDNMECPICLMKFNDDEDDNKKCLFSSCPHAMHLICLKEFFDRSNNRIFKCPNCRRHINGIALNDSRMKGPVDIGNFWAYIATMYRENFCRSLLKANATQLRERMSLMDYFKIPQCPPVYSIMHTCEPLPTDEFIIEKLIKDMYKLIKAKTEINLPAKLEVKISNEPPSDLFRCNINGDTLDLWLSADIDSQYCYIDNFTRAIIWLTKSNKYNMNVLKMQTKIRLSAFGIREREIVDYASGLPSAFFQKNNKHQYDTQLVWILKNIYWRFNTLVLDNHLPRGIAIIILGNSGSDFGQVCNYTGTCYITLRYNRSLFYQITVLLEIMTKAFKHNKIKQVYKECQKNRNLFLNAIGKDINMNIDSDIKDPLRVVLCQGRCMNCLY